MTTRSKSLTISTVTLLLFSVGWQFKSSSPVRFGKIYLFEQTLYVNELTRGVRQLDISTPGSPTNVGLVDIAGNHDTAIRGTADGRRILYADSYSDLVVFDVTVPSSPQMVDSLKNIFGRSYAIGWGDNILLGRPTAMPVANSVGGLRGCGACSEVVYVDQPAEGWASDAGALRTMGASSGRGGSMARFAIVDDYLYTVDYDELYVFDITDASKPRFVNRVVIGWGIETIFPYTDYLFIGGENGMFIYSRSDPRNPKHISTFQHVRACDPVVVEDTLAYVTLRGGTRCGTVVSALHIVKVADLFNPKLLVSYPLPQPIGLDVRERIAYVCDDSAGVFILDANNLDNIRELARITGKPAYDTLLQNDVLIVVSAEVVSFYNVAQPNSPQFLGSFLLPA